MPQESEFDLWRMRDEEGYRGDRNTALAHATLPSWSASSLSLSEIVLGLLTKRAIAGLVRADNVNATIKQELENGNVKMQENVCGKFLSDCATASVELGAKSQRDAHRHGDRPLRGSYRWRGANLDLSGDRNGPPEHHRRGRFILISQFAAGHLRIESFHLWFSGLRTNGNRTQSERDGTAELWNAIRGGKANPRSGRERFSLKL